MSFAELVRERQMLICLRRLHVLTIKETSRLDYLLTVPHPAAVGSTSPAKKLSQASGRFPGENRAMHRDRMRLARHDPPNG